MIQLLINLYSLSPYCQLWQRKSKTFKCICKTIYRNKIQYIIKKLKVLYAWLTEELKTKNSFV